MDDQLLLVGELLWRASWQGAILAIIVLTLIAVLGRWLTPTWRYGLWLVVIVRLAMPVLPTASWSVWRLTDALPVTTENVIPKKESVSAISSSNGHVPTTELFTVTTQSFNWSITLMWLWLAGTTVGIGWLTISWFHLRRQISRSPAIVDPRVEIAMKMPQK